jgi:maltose alpha-D-glucosyltransferase/alpha-amylase
VIIDFEGEPARPISERKIKRTPLRDVAGMLRSFHYAAYAALPGYTRQATARSIDRPKLEPWSRFWHRWAERFFVEAYLEQLEGTRLLPTSPQEIDLLLDVLTLEKAVYEVGYEINNRPRWSKIPLSAIVARLKESETE